MLRIIITTRYKRHLRTLLAVALISLMLIASFLTWVITGPRSLDFATSYLEKKLNKLCQNNLQINNEIVNWQPHKIKISHTIIKWSEKEKNISIIASDTNILDSNEKILATFPTIAFRFNFLTLLFSNFLSPDIFINSPSIYLYSKYDYKKSPIEVIENSKENFIYLIKKRLDRSNHLSMHSITINNATISIDNGNSNIAWHMPYGYIENERKFVSGKFSIQSIQGENITLRITANRLKDGSINATSSVTGLTSSIIRDIFPKNIWNDRTKFVINGNINALIDTNNNINKIDFNIINSEGIIQIPQYFLKEIQIDNLNARGSFEPSLGQIAFKFLTVDSKDSKFIINGLFSNIVDFSDKFPPKLNFNVIVNNLKIDDLKYYWPIGIKENLRNWITTHLKGGKISTSHGSFIINPDDFKLLALHHKIALEDPIKLKDLPLPPKGLIDATINVENTTVNYFPKFPYAHNTSGVIKLDNKSMSIHIPETNILESVAKNIEINIDNFWLKPSFLTVQADIDAKAQDVIEYVKASLENEHLNNKKLNSLYQIKGQAKGNLYLNIPIRKEVISYNDIELKANANFSHVTLPKFFADKDINNANLNVTLHNNNLSVSGTGQLMGISFYSEYIENFVHDDNGFISTNNIKSYIDSNKLKLLGINNIPTTNTPFELNIIITENKDGFAIEGKSDLTKVVIDFPQYNFYKAAHKKAVLNFNAKTANNETNFHYFNLAGDNLNINGKFVITKDNKLKAANFNHLQFGKNDISLEYTSGKNYNKFNIFGNNLDLSKSKFNSVDSSLNKNAQDNSEIKKSNTLLIIDSNIKNIIMKNNVSLNDFKLKLNCLSLLCKKLEGYSKINNTYYIKAQTKTDKHNIILESDNAGYVIRALGISNNIEQGNLIIKSDSSKSSNGRITSNGSIHINNFKAIKTPMLGKILSLSSFKGYTDLLEDKGITFDKFDANIVLEDKIITITHAKTTGSSIGLTGSGSINLTNNDINIKGILIPAQEINNIVGTIPIIGNIIKGGHDGGIIATNYRISGKYDDADVSVNPLSILTPGFLRNIFN